MSLQKSIIIVLIIIHSSLSVISQCSVDTWTQKANFGGVARREAVGFSIGNKGYIGTGYDGNTRLQDFWEYNLTGNSWTQKADVGGGVRDYAVGFSVGNKGYIGGGYSPFMKDFWEYDTTANTWTQKNDIGGSDRAGGIAFTIGNKAYVGLGWNGTLFNDFWEYNPGSGAWTQKANFAGPARLFAIGFSIGSKGYAGLGGENFHNYKNDFWEYDPVLNLWIKKSDFPSNGREGAVGLSISGKGYAGMGYDGPLGNLTFYKDIWQYNPVADVWCRKTDFPGFGRYYAVSFSMSNNGYIGTGYHNTNGQIGDTLLNDFWEYCPDTSAFIVPLTISPNATICHGNSTMLSSGGVVFYSWSPFIALDNPTIANPVANPDTSVIYTVMGSLDSICYKTASVLVTVIPSPVLVASPGITICEGSVAGLSVSGAAFYTWAVATGLSSTSGASVTADPTVTITYTITGTDNFGCSSSIKLKIAVDSLPMVIASADVSICIGFSAVISAAGSTAYSWSPSAGLSSTKGASIIASPTLTTNYIVNVYSGVCPPASDTVKITVSPLPIANAGNDITIHENYTAVLTATGGINYMWIPATYLSCTNCNTTVSQPEYTITYTVVVTDDRGCVNNAVVTVFVVNNQTIYIPNSFTPNEDGSNNVFYVYGEQIKSIELTIFNRWGELLFKTNDINQGWDGRYKGNFVSEGIYIYKVNCTWNDNENKLIMGNLNLIK